MLGSKGGNGFHFVDVGVLAQGIIHKGLFQGQKQDFGHVSGQSVVRHSQVLAEFLAEGALSPAGIDQEQG